MRLQQGFTTGEIGLRLQLRGSNPEPLMSALGQKRTFGKVRVMSALPPKADMDQHRCDVRFVPKADISHCGKNVAIRAPRRLRQGTRME